MHGSDGSSPGLSFPCRFPVKAFLRPGAGVEARVVERVSLAAGCDTEHRRRDSRDGRYVCLTLIFEATSHEQVERVRAALVADPDVILSL